MGIIVVLANTTYPLAAEAMLDTTALKWDYETTIRLMEQYPRLALNGLRLVSNRFQELQERYRELSTERVEQRVARALLRLTRGKWANESTLASSWICHLRVRTWLK